MSPTDKHGRILKRSDRVKRKFGRRRIEYYATVLSVAPHAIQVLWDNGELETLDEWDCQDLEVLE